jgi:hypothetical protein
MNKNIIKDVVPLYSEPKNWLLTGQYSDGFLVINPADLLTIMLQMWGASGIRLAKSTYCYAKILTEWIIGKEHRFPFI